MKLLKREEIEKATGLVKGWDETFLWSWQQGLMGRAWVSGEEPYRSVQIIVGDMCFLAGQPQVELAGHIPGTFSSPFLLVVPQTAAWETAIEQAQPTARRTTRYAFQKDPTVFDQERLRGFASQIPEGFTIKQIDQSLYQSVKAQEWSKDLCSQFAGYPQYANHGLGFVILYQGKVVSGASSYTYYDKGIEIEIDTHPDFRRRGLAQACAAKLILACRERGLYPSWDAANRASVSLAEKLGYHLEREYLTYEVAVPIRE